MSDELVDGEGDDIFAPPPPLPPPPPLSTIDSNKKLKRVEIRDETGIVILDTVDVLAEQDEEGDNVEEGEEIEKEEDVEGEGVKKKVFQSAVDRRCVGSMGEAPPLKEDYWRDADGGEGGRGEEEAEERKQRRPTTTKEAPRASQEAVRTPSAAVEAPPTQETEVVFVAVEKKGKKINNKNKKKNEADGKIYYKVFYNFRISLMY